jgi:FAD/FMN-containing dehydrogenase
MKIATDLLRELQQQVSGNIITPGNSLYDQTRQIWNAMIDRKPAVIAQCAAAEDVAPCIAFARQNGLSLSVRGAGHNIAGNSMCDDGLVIDFSLMRNVQVDAADRRAWVDPGATLADVDRATQAHGLAIPLGINSTTGISGLTLGGGFGWLTRKYGMTVDSLISADMVTADGIQRRVSATETSDLFWAIRGGGGNFGVVTRFEFRLHPVGPEVTAGLIVFPFAQAQQVLSRYGDFVRSAPEDLNAWVVVRRAPALPFLAPEVHGKEVVVLAVFQPSGPPSGAAALARLRSFGDALGEHVGPMAYTQWQQAFDPLLGPGARNYWKSHNFKELGKGAIDTIVQFAGNLPTSQCEIFLGLVSGAANRIPTDETAYAHRDANLVLNVHGRWDNASDDRRCIGWARDFFKASAPYASAGVYVNFMTEDETDRIAAAYGSSYRRLAEIKTKYDPLNVFRMNQNIKPAPV